MSVYMAVSKGEASLSHHGILGQKWGIRRYQNPDGTLTPEGKSRYGNMENITNSPLSKKSERLQRKVSSAETDEKRSKYNKALNKSRVKDQAKELKKQIKYDKRSTKGDDILRRYNNDTGLAFTKTEHSATLHRLVDPFIGAFAGAPVGALIGAIASGGEPAGALAGAYISSYLGSTIGGLTGATAEWRASTKKGNILDASNKRIKSK